MVDGEKYTDIGLRFKGNSSYRLSANGLKRPLKIDTNKYNKDQKLHGRDKLNLSNAVGIPGRQSRRLCWLRHQVWRR
jgi:hypothetical protein